MIIRPCCPHWGAVEVKKPGSWPQGKQSHRCPACGRQFVGRFEQRLMPSVVASQATPHGLGLAVAERPLTAVSIALGALGVGVLPEAGESPRCDPLFA